MLYTFEYTTQEERTGILENNQDKYLIEERNIREGNFLIFTDVKPIEMEIEDLKGRQNTTDNTILSLMDAILMGGM